MDRKAVKAAWKERGPDAGIYALRDGDGDRVWVGAAMRLGAVEARLRFMRRTGLATGGPKGVDPTAVRFEVLEAFDVDILPMTRARLLKERAAYWIERLGAEGV